MTDASDDDSLLDRIRSTANDAVRRAASALQTRAVDLDESFQKLAPALATHENIERFQKTMETLTRVLYGIGFSVDPDAQRLFEFMDWVELEHGRSRVLEGLERYNPLFRESFANVLHAARGAAVPGGASGTEFREHLERYRDSASLDALQFLAHLAERQAEGSPPSRDADALEAYIRGSDIPEQFEGLVDRVRGRAPSSRRTNDRTDPDSDLDNPDDLGDRMRALVRRSVGFDRQLQFLSVGFLFASQGFLTRTALESLPEIVERSNLDDRDDIVDI